MTVDLSTVKIRTTVVEMEPFLVSGEKYEAKVMHVYGPDMKEIFLPKGCHGWGIYWGRTQQEAKGKAEDGVRKLLNSL